MEITLIGITPQEIEDFFNYPIWVDEGPGGYFYLPNYCKWDDIILKRLASYSITNTLLYKVYHRGELKFNPQSFKSI